MTHVAQSVIEAVVAACESTSTAGSNVEATRGYPRGAVPGISVRLATIEPVIENSNAFLDSYVDVETIYHVQGDELALDSQLLEIDAEVYSAVMADRTLGGVAFTLDPQSLTADSNADAEKPTASGIRRWRVHVRHSIDNAEA